MRSIKHTITLVILLFTISCANSRKAEQPTPGIGSKTSTNFAEANAGKVRRTDPNPLITITSGKVNVTHIMREGAFINSTSLQNASTSERIRLQEGLHDITPGAYYHQINFSMPADGKAYAESIVNYD